MISTPASTLADQIRPHFPALRRTIDGRAVAYFDGPGGTQVPQVVVDAIADYLLNHNANDGWAYRTSVETDKLLKNARAAAADFLNAASIGEVLFGNNMTTLTFHIARAVGRMLAPGDEIVVTDLDHHADVDPWVALARDYGAVIRRVPLRAGTPALDVAAYEALLSPRTKLVALGMSSNAFGTINPVESMIASAHAVGALTFVDAVHAAAHAALDVRALDTDMLAFSAYKVYGPHVGVMYCRDAVLARLDVPKLAPQANDGYKRGESGTLNFEGIIGTGAAIDFLAEQSTGATRRERLVATFARLVREEDVLFEQLRTGLRALPTVRTYEPPADSRRHPTIAFSVAGMDAQAVSQRLSDEHNVFVSHGNFYAMNAVAGVAPDAPGGVVRAGLGIYTTADDVALLLAGIASL